jgi:hypothetical protein
MNNIAVKLKPFIPTSSPGLVPFFSSDDDDDDDGMSK